MALALVGLWVVYLVPQVLRHRQQLLDSRAEDRYSEALRVVAVTRRATSDARARAPRRSARRQHARVDCGRSGHTTGLLTPGRGQLKVSIANEGGATVDRPLATGQHLSLEASRERARAQAAFAAAVSRRGAAARRRGVLAAMMALLSVAGWAAAIWLPTATVVVGVVPSALLVLVVGLGRRAVVAGVRHDAQWREIIAELERGGRAKARVTPAADRSGGQRPARAQRAVADGEQSIAGATPNLADEPVATGPLTAGTPRATAATRSAVGPRRPGANLETTAIPVSGAHVVGRAVRPSEALTDVFDVIVGDRGEKGGGARHASGATPVVAEAPTDAAAEPDEGSWSPIPVPPPTYVLKPAAPRREPAPLTDGLAADLVAQAPEVEVRTTGSIDLDAVLERRRASGQ